MPEQRSTRSTTASTSKVSREAEREGKFQDIIDIVKALMAEDADGNEEQAKKTLLRAHRSAKEVRHWGEIAKCWFHYFLDMEQTKTCFFKAVEIAGGSPTVATIEYRIKEVDDAGKVARHVIGHRMVPARVYLHSLMAATLCLQDETEEQVRFMTMAENEAENCRSSMRAFDQFDEDTLTYFDKAESQLGWLHIARCWWEGLRTTPAGASLRGQGGRARGRDVDHPQLGRGGQALGKGDGRTRGGPPLRGRGREASGKTHSPRVHHAGRGSCRHGRPGTAGAILGQGRVPYRRTLGLECHRLHLEELGYFDRAERANNISEYLSSKVTQDEYLASGGGHGRYVPGEGPY